MCASLQRQFALGQAAHEIFKILRQLVVARIGDELVEVAGNRADVLGDAPFVVVEDADESLRRVADVVHRLEGNAVGQRRVAENADDVFVRAAFVARRRHAQRGGKRRARVARAVAIVLAFGAQREAVQAVRLADGAEAVLAAGQKLVDVDLMAHVPDKFVLGRVENAVQRDGQLHHAEVRAEVAAVLGEAGDQFLPDFAGEFLQLRQRQFFDVLRAVHHVEVSAHNCCWSQS